MALRAISGAAAAVAVGAPGVPSILAKCGIPFIIAPTGTMANNGAITLGTALPTTYANCYLYLPASAIQAGSAAGWYFAQMSSTTAGTVFNNTYSSGAPTIPASPTPFVTTGPGAYTGVITAVTGPQITVPAGMLGPNGALRLTNYWAMPNNVNNKTLSAQFGGSSIYSQIITTEANSLTQSLVTNRGVQTAQLAPPQGTNGIGQGAGGFTYLSVNTANAQVASLGGTLAVATDFIVLEAFLIEVMP